MSQTGSLDDAKRRILERTSLEGLIQEQVPLTRRGSRLTGLCPFHAEKSPSFYVFEDHYHCFGCHAHGDAISFVRQTKNLSFVESLRFLAGKFGVDAPELAGSAAFQLRKNEHTALAKIMVHAQEFFMNELSSERGASAQSYLQQRGFSPDNISSFGFGLTPSDHFGLTTHLRSLRFRDEDIVKVGLASVSTKSGSLYDFFRERIMIPIKDPAGRVIAFGGRATNDDPAKYKNTMATPLFDKGGVLFGLDRAKNYIKEKNRAVLVEGYMDALCLWQEGFKESVACMGTAHGLRHMKLLQTHARCSEVVLLFDGDNAGRNATLDAIEVALAAPTFRVRAAMLPEGEDPDTFVRKHGSEALETLLNKAHDLIEVAIEHQLKKASGAAVPTVVSETFVPWLSRITDPVKRSFLATKISDRSGISAEAITRQIKSLYFQGDSKIRKPMPSPSSSIDLNQSEIDRLPPTRPLSPVEESFIGHLFHGEPGEIDVAIASDFLLREIHLEPTWDTFAKKLLQLHQNKKSPSQFQGEVLASFAPDELQVLNKIIESKSLSYHSINRMESLRSLAKEQKKRAIQKAISAMKAEVHIAGARTPEAVPDMLQQIMTLNKALASLQDANP
jgi:DNA primase